MLNFFVKRPVAVTMLYAAILLLGGISLSRLKVSLFPDIVFPRLTILTPYMSVAPEEIENLVTRPIEDAVSSVSGVRKIVSRSQEGVSLVDVTLDWGVSIDQAVINIRQKTDLARSILPQDTGKSIIAKFDPASDPVITLVVQPGTLSFEKTRDYVDKNVRPFLERINGVSSLSILGGRKREIQVNVDSQKLFSYGLSIDGVTKSLSSANFNFPAGNVKKGDKEYTVRVQGRFKSPEHISQSIVSMNEGGTPVYLHQTADILDSYKEQTGASFYNGKPSVIIGLKKEPGKNTIETAANIRESLKDINKRFKGIVRLEVIQDGSVYIKDSIASVRNAALMGTIIAFFVLLLFLKDIRAALIIIVSIPVAILATFILMFMRDISLNIMSLGGLAMGVGMLVDNAIVVLESIFKEQETYPGRSAKDNSIAGTRKVSTSVIASTLTSIVVFVPIIFVSGIAGEVFRELALTVSFSLMSSLFCALSLIPMLAGIQPKTNSLPARMMERVNTLVSPAFRITEALVNALRNSYVKALGFAIKRPARFLSVSFTLAIMGGIFFVFVPWQLFPEIDRGSVELKLTLPGGTGIQDSENLHKRIHEYLKKNNLSVHAVSHIGYDENDINSRLRGVKKGNYSENLFYLNQEEIQSLKFIKELDVGLTRTTQSERSFRVKGDALQELLGSNSKYLILDVESRHRSEARKAAAWLEAELAKSKLISTVISSARADEPEIQIHLDRERIGAMGLTPEAVAGIVRTAVHGQVASIYREGDREIPIRVRLRKEHRQSADQMGRLFIQAGKNGATTIGSFFTTKENKGYNTILRKNQRRIERLKIEYLPGKKEEVQALVETLQARVGKEMNFPEDSGFSSEAYLENQETLDSLKNLLFAFALSSILIYQLLAGQFESLLHPFTLALSIPLMFFGVSGALLLTGNSLNISSAIGMIMLVGIVVNSVIVLYEFIDQNKAAAEQGEGPAEFRKADGSIDLQEILIYSGRERIRPILLTTLTTLLGLLPMALGLGAGGDLQAPMAVVVIGGLTVSSVLSLIAFPTLYYMFETRRAATAGARNLSPIVSLKRKLFASEGALEQ